MRLLVLANSRLGSRRRSTRTTRNSTRSLTANTDRGGWSRWWHRCSPPPHPSRSSPPGLGRELGAVFPALVRARNDCFVALDLDPGNLGLALGASFTTVALKEAHGHSPFLPDLWVNVVPARCRGFLCTFKTVQTQGIRRIISIA